ncbi:hypothetical protein [Chromobacterium amazonense]|uniref:flagellin N-terminal helical domain-containing protein n=1 Tax=Chromobacterium amazonense TaxID=1382803 RepID=UPI0031F6A1E0
MRVTDKQFNNLMLNLVAKAGQSNADSMNRIATGSRLLRPSDDPIGAMRVARYVQMEMAVTQYNKNLSRLTDKHQQNEQQLQSIVHDLREVKSGLIKAKDASTNSADLVSYVNQIASLRDNIVSLSNSTDYGGQYIFSGTAVTTPPIAFDPDADAGSRYSWKGNTSTQMVQVAANEWQPSNVTLPEVAGFLNTLDIAVELALAPGATNGDEAVQRALSNALSAVDNISDSVDSKIAFTGYVRDFAALLGNAHDGTTLSLRDSAAEIDGADIAEESIEVNSYLVALEATQKIYAKIMNTSVLDIL